MTAVAPVPADPGSRRAAMWVVLGAVAVALILLAAFQAVFLPLLVAVGVAYVLEPVVARVAQRVGGRPLAVNLVFGVVVLAGLLVAGGLLVQAKALVDWLTADDGHVLREASKRLLGVIEDLLGAETRARWQAGLDAMRDPERLREFTGPAVRLLQGLGAGLITVFSALTFVVLLPVYLFYLMHELPRLWAWAVARVPARNREVHLRVLATIHAGMAGFLRGFVMIALLKGVLIAIGLLVLGVKFAPIVGIASGLLSVVPFLGALVGYAVAVVLSLAEAPDLGTVLWISGVYVAAEVVEGFVLQPAIMRQGTGLHPLIVLVSVMFWGAALGLAGAVVAIPLTIVLQAVVRAYVLPSVERLAA